MATFTDVPTFIWVFGEKSVSKVAKWPKKVAKWPNPETKVASKMVKKYPKMG